MKVKCKQECRNFDGVKTMAFTKGNVYDVIEQTDCNYVIIDDNKEKELFFRLDAMFDIIQICYKTNKPCEHNCEGLCKESC